MARPGRSAPVAGGLTHGTVSRSRDVEPSADGRLGDRARLRRRQLGHDIRHELATIILLASLLDSAADVGPESRRRARQILDETRWLEQLHRAYEETLGGLNEPVSAVAEPIRLDRFAAEVVSAIGLSTSTTIRFRAEETWAYADRLAFWRALRNVIGNAVRAAGPHGHVDVRIYQSAGWTVTQVDDDGPGFGAVPPGTDSLGLSIVREFAVAAGGQVEIRQGSPGGCRVRLRMRAAPPGEAHPVPGECDAAADL
jgi:signal transduction histidine kinase